MKQWMCEAAGMGIKVCDKMALSTGLRVSSPKLGWCTVIPPCLTSSLIVHNVDSSLAVLSVTQMFLHTYITCCTHALTCKCTYLHMHIALQSGLKVVGVGCRVKTTKSVLWEWGVFTVTSTTPLFQPNDGEKWRSRRGPDRMISK